MTIDQQDRLSKKYVPSNIQATIYEAAPIGVLFQDKSMLYGYILVQYYMYYKLSSFLDLQVRPFLFTTTTLRKTNGKYNVSHLLKNGK